MWDRPIGIDLFCGAGGMSLGFEQAGFQVVAAVDANDIHIATHDQNFPFCRSLTADMTTVTGEQLRALAGLTEQQPVDVLFGGPPCQGLSWMGKRDAADPRNQMILEFARLIGELQPKYFVLENVEGLLFDYGLTLVEQFAHVVNSQGYNIIRNIQVLDAADFGVPQHRLRTFILGYKEGLTAPVYPIPFHERVPALSAPTVWDAISDLPNIDRYPALLIADIHTKPLLKEASAYAKVLRGELSDPDDKSWMHPFRAPGLSGCKRTRHSRVVKARFSRTKQGHQEPVSRFYRLKQDGRAHTLRAGTGADHGSHTAARPIHPTQPRCISVREAARLQSFPDWFTLDVRKWHALQQLGNAVPPLLARAVAKEIYRALTTDLVQPQAPTQAPLLQPQVPAQLALLIDDSDTRLEVEEILLR